MVKACDPPTPATIADYGGGIVPPQQPPVTFCPSDQPDDDDTNIVAVRHRRDRKTGRFVRVKPGDPKPPKWSVRFRRWLDLGPFLPGYGPTAA